MEGTDYDNNNDGTLELPSGALQIDAIADTDGGAGDIVYGGVTFERLGADGMTRFLNNTSANDASAWYGGDLLNTTQTEIQYDNSQSPSVVTGNFPNGGHLTPGDANTVDDVPNMNISNATVTEGDSGTVDAVFTVTLVAPSAQTVRVNYATGSVGTLPATADEDYVSVASTPLVFAPGETTKDIHITVNGDTLNESDERFAVRLGLAVNATTTDGEGLGVITNDDAVPTLSLADVTVPEGDSGTTDATFNVNLSAPSGKTVTVKYATVASGSVAATAGSDYTAITLTTLTFAPGETSKPVTVTVNGDTLDEADERFVLRLSAGVNATIADNEGIGTITDDDAAPSLSIIDATVTEGNSGTIPANFTVSLSAASGKTVTVKYATVASNSVPATAGSDYVAVTLTTLTFAPGETSKPVAITVNGDTLNEGNERFSVVLSNAANATLADREGVGIITDDDAVPSLRINDLTLAEGDSGTTDFTFNVTLSAASGKTVTVKYATGNPDSIPATAGVDYTAVALTTLTFAPGETSKSVTISVNGDATVEGTERFLVKLSAATNATVADSEGFGTITNDDVATLLAPFEDEPSQ